MRGNCSPVGIQCAINLLVGAGTDTRPDHDHQVQAAQQHLLQPKTFFDQAFDPVTFYRIAASLYRHGQAEPRMIALIGSRQNRNLPIADLVFTALEDPLILRRRKQAAIPGIVRRRIRQGNAVRRTVGRGPWHVAP